MSWEDEQHEEASWWGDCTNTYGEEEKQTVYAELMGLELLNVGGPGPIIDMEDKSVLDIGGGPCSLLLKTRTTGRKELVDPCKYPEWVGHRYSAADISWYRMKGEVVRDRFAEVETRWDECWIYNVLQHTDDPELVVKNALWAAPVVRIFEWVDKPVSPGHPHTLTAKELDDWLGIRNSSVSDCFWLTSRGCYGRGYVAVVRT